MAIVRELVTRLRYDVDSRGVSGYRLAIDRAAAGARQATASIRSSGASASGAAAGFGRATTALGNMATRASMVNDQIRDVYMNRYSRAWRGVTNYIRGANRQVDAHGNKVRGAADDTKLLWRAWGALGAVIGGVSLVRITDEFRGAEDQINQMVEGSQNQEKAYQGVYSIARKTRNEFAGLAGLFSSLQFSTEQTGLNLDDNLKLTEAIAKAVKIGGGNKAGQDGALIQTIQGFQSGKFQAEELNSILDGAKGLARAIAEGMGVQVGELKQLASDGELTAETVSQAILSQSAVLEAQFGNIRKSFGDVGTQVSNVIGGMIRDFERGSGAISWAIGGLLSTIDGFEYAVRGIGRWMSDVFGGAENAVRFLGYAITGAVGTVAIRKVYGMVSAFRELGREAKLARLAAFGSFTAIAGAIVAALLVGDDLVAWARGADSVFGQLVGSFDEWKPAIDEVAESFRLMWEPVSKIAGEIGLWDDKQRSLSEAISGMSGTARTLFGGLLNSIKEVNQNLAQTVQGFTALSEGDFSGAGAAFGGILKRAGSGVKDRVTGIGGIVGDAFKLQEGGFAETLVNGFRNAPMNKNYIDKMGARSNQNIRGGDINVTNNNTISTASGSPSQVGAAVGRATENSARSLRSAPWLSPMVERQP